MLLRKSNNLEAEKKIQNKQKETPAVGRMYAGAFDQIREE